MLRDDAKPTLRLVDSLPAGPGGKPLAQLEAEAMFDCAAYSRARLIRLPPESVVRMELLRACDDALLAARLQWPAVVRPAAVAPQ